MKKKAWIILVSIIVLAVGAVVAVATKAEGTASLYLTPAASEMPPDLDLEIKLDTAGNQVGFARVELKFDQTAVQLRGEITGGSELDNLISKTSMADANSTGNILLVVGLTIENRDTPPSGILTLGRLPFTAVTGGENVVTDVDFNLEGIQIVDMNAVVVETTTTKAVVTINPVSPTVTPAPTPLLTPTPTILPKAALTLVSDRQPVVGEDWPVGVELATTEQVSGVDMEVTFDPVKLTILRVEDEALLAGNTQTDTTQAGVIKVSQVSSPGEGFSGTGRLVTLVLRPETAGEVGLGWNFTAGATNDSNVIALVNGEDILAAPSGLTVTAEVKPRLQVKLTTYGNNQVTGKVGETGGIWEAAMTTDANGMSAELLLGEGFLGKTTNFYLKVSGYLIKKEGVTVNPGVTVADFGKLVAGDLNNDGIINNVDLSLMYDQWFGGGGADYNSDGIVNSADHWILTHNFFAVDE